jgi:deazaflavin-dependent oxidoreductase (nitroreductase family)
MTEVTAPGVPRIAQTLCRWMGSRSGPAFVPGLHRFVYERSGGRVGHGVIGLPSLLLRSTGRHTGLLRTSALVYGRDGSSLIVVASNYGGPHDPAWLANVRADPRVRVQVARRQVDAEAEVVSPGDADYDRLMAVMNRVTHDRYVHYRARTTRPIRLVVIRPAGSGDPVPARD